MSHNSVQPSSDLTSFDQRLAEVSAGEADIEQATALAVRLVRKVAGKSPTLYHTLQPSSESTDKCDTEQGRGDTLHDDRPPELVDRFVEFVSIGEGGQACVYRAFDRQLDRPVAIKILKHDLNRFEREARVIAQLEHEHICRIRSLDLGQKQLPGLAIDPRRTTHFDV